MYFRGAIHPRDILVFTGWTQMLVLLCCYFFLRSHLISAKIVERERDDQARGVKEAVYIRILPNINRDEGRHHLSHLYDDLLGATAHT